MKHMSSMSNMALGTKLNLYSIDGTCHQDLQQASIMY